jgi:hypothetical protein
MLYVICYMLYVICYILYMICYILFNSQNNLAYLSKIVNILDRSIKKCMHADIFPKYYLNIIYSINLLNR